MQAGKSERLVETCLAAAAAHEQQVRAWAHLDAGAALAQARARDAEPPRSALHGVPVAIKDIIDTADMPTAYGSPIYAGNRPTLDAACVALLRAAGAVILGKTETAEFAAMNPARTRNPHNPRHTPGGSSAGSAAAVAAGMAPLALGTQTAGSVIRPAAYCGVVGFKPTFGVLPTAGIKPGAPSLDTLGAFAAKVADVGPLFRLLGGDPEPKQPLTARTPRFAVMRGPRWDAAQPAAVSALDAVVEATRLAGAPVAELDVPDWLASLSDLAPIVMRREMYLALSHERLRHGDLLSANLQRFFAEGDKWSLAEYVAALGRIEAARPRWDETAADYDAVLTAAAPGEAPAGDTTTGDPVLNRAWTALHGPCICLPAGRGPAGLPVAVQLVGARGEDWRLMQAAAWLERILATTA